MQKTKIFNKIVVAFVVFTMLAIYGSIPNALASSLSMAKDVLSTSAPSAAATHTISFGTNIVLPNNGSIEVTIPAEFGDVSTGSCPGGGSYSTSTRKAYCQYVGGLATSSSLTITLNNIVNASSTGNYIINIVTKDHIGGTVLESADLELFIMDQVTTSASVSSSMSLQIGSQVGSGTLINGVTTTGTSTATSIPFGNMTAGVTSTLAQAITVSTNASNGYTVTVQQDGEMRNGSGATINSFDNSPDGTGSTTPHAWNNPTGILGSTNTYGHMGVTSNDATNGTGPDFNGSKFAGLNGTAPLQIMYHNGPADGTTQNIGMASVAYSVKITALQEAGDYTNTLTYVCTPVY